MSLFFISSKKASQKCKSPKPSRKFSVNDAKNCRIYISSECAKTLYKVHKKLGHRSVGETIRWLLMQIKPTADSILHPSDHPKPIATLDSLNNMPSIGQQMEVVETLPSIHGGPSSNLLLNENNNILPASPLFDDAAFFSSLPSIFNVDEASPGTLEFGFNNNNMSLPPIFDLDDKEGGFSTSMPVFTAPQSLAEKSFPLENGFAFNYNNCNNVPLVPSDATLPIFGTAGETSMSADARSFHLGK